MLEAGRHAQHLPAIIRSFWVILSSAGPSRTGPGPESNATGAIGIAAASLALLVAAGLCRPLSEYFWRRVTSDGAHTGDLFDSTTRAIIHAWHTPQQGLLSGGL